MHLWRCAFAVVLGMVWYFSESGYFLVQVACCALGFLTFYLNGGNNNVCESSTQTDCAADEDTSQQKSEIGCIVGRDYPDTAVQTVQKASHQSQYPKIQRSLQHVFKCAYTHLVLPWSTAPEPGDSQPLYTALLTEYNFVMDEIIYKAKDLDLSVTALGCIQTITKHLRNTKQSEGTPAFSSKAEEMEVVRGFCKALIHNLLPKHLWEPNVYYCALQEILAMKVVEFVTLLSDPDNLNHLIVSQLDQVPSGNLLEVVHDPDRDTPSSNSSENNDVLQAGAEEHPCDEGKAKKKGKNPKEKFSKFFENIKRKKTKLKRKEKNLTGGAVSVRRPAVVQVDDTHSSEGSICDNVETDVESLTSSLQEEMMEFKLSYEMWRVGEWAVTVTNVQMDGNELCFTFHLEDRNNPENLHWDVTRKLSDIIQFCKEIGPPPFLSTIVEKPKTEWSKEEAREDLEHSLQDLVTNIELGKSELVFKFLGPIDWILHEEEHNEWVWVLLGRIAFFLTPGQDDQDDQDDQDNDELSNPKGDEEQHEVNTTESTPQHGPDATQQMCTDPLERQDKETANESFVADGEHLPIPEQTSTCTSTKQLTDHTADQPEVNPDGIQSDGLNIAQFAVRTKYIQFEHVKRNAAAYRSSENDENSSIHGTDEVSVSNSTGNISKVENLPHRKSSETDKPERKEKESHPEKETLIQPSGETKMSNHWEQPEANKVIFDLLKEISGNSYTVKFMKAIVTPFTPLINKKVNGFLKNMNPSEAQIATYIDTFCKNIWPASAEPQPLPQSSDNKKETKQKAMQIMTSKCTYWHILCCILDIFCFKFTAMSCFNSCRLLKHQQNQCGAHFQDLSEWRRKQEAGLYVADISLESVSAWRTWF
ncbi:uncharacterized protein si:rp71-46j2.7 isoform X1 [Ictalurus punctatus]|uniref:Uncharacterized protein si:rp71-46j2.7 isoform X1 n=1 Tax=Ictalurus punctatus TaxID=7998 RepID=A0A2D0RJG4_ICTPU|nr:uncharacterized protein si:rp71-46j2.7 isoform X1 [Ictalurus punctatus]